MPDTFKVTEGAKAMEIDIVDLIKTVQIGAGMSPK
jgi:hypothetical protein